MSTRKLLLAAIALLATLMIGATVAATAPSSTVKSYALRATLAPAPHARGAAHARGRFTGSIALKTSTGTLTWKVSFTGLTGAATVANIRLAPSRRTIIPLCAPCHTGQGGSFSGPIGSHSMILKAILGGHTYVNVDTTKNPAGEIRGYLHASATGSG